MIHLIYAFTPLAIGNYAWTQEELKEKQCCICAQKLMSKDETFSKLHELTEVSLNNLCKSIKNEITPQEAHENIATIFDHKILGVVSPNSTKAFCSSCHELFVEWISTMILHGNHEISKIIHKRMKQLDGQTL
jgi:hypothetical protein